MAPRFPCESHTGSYHNFVHGAPRVLVLHFVASGEAVLKAVIVLDVLVVEILLILVELANFFGLLGDGGSLGGCLGEGLLGAATFGPIVRVALGVAVGFLEFDGLLPALLGDRLRPVEAAEEVSPPRGFFRGEWS
jgi:hypothetical protein